jgi:SNF2 family DNA or RNA helicase
MLALHAAWTSEDRLALWTEPAQALEDLLPDAPRTELVLLLPCSERGPLPSPQVWLDEPIAEPATQLAPCTVPARELGPPEALDWLLEVRDGGGVVLGSSVHFLAQLARFALELASRGQLAPAVLQERGRYVARWRPLLGEAQDQERLATLIRGVPPLLRGTGGSPRPAGPLVRQALAALADAAARDALGARASKIGEPLLAALSRPDPALPEDLPGLPLLASRLEAWAQPGQARNDTFRTCFRISAPDEEHEGELPPMYPTWRVDFLLQAVDDPSLLVPAEDVFRTRGRVLRAGERDLADPQEKLLGDLGRATRLAPVLQGSLHAARPSQMQLDAGSAWRFLREVAPVLAQSGFGVLAPRWWGRPRRQLGVRLRATPKEGQSASKSALGLDALCQVTWEVALGEEVLSPEELEELAALKAPLVKLRGEWVELRPEDIEAALAFYLKAPRDGAELSAREILQMGLGLQGGDGLPVVGLVGEGWLGELLSEAREARFSAVPAPEVFRATLRPYQQRGLGWLLFHDALGLGACLADDMGLGKTVQLLALLVHERQGGARPAPTLLVCPMSLVGNWQREASKFAPQLVVRVHHGASRRRQPEVQADLVLTTYALAARDAKALSEVSWGRIVLDEAQNIKNGSTRQARAVHALPAPRRIALTGTPVENRLSELWSILEFLNPGLLGSATAFRKRFALPIERYGDEEAARALRRVTGPFILRRLKTDKTVVADLPDKVEMKVLCNLTREQATLYKAVVDDLLEKVASLDEAARRGAVLGAMTRLKQVCDHPALLLQDRSALPGRSGKLARLEEILQTVLANDEKALVFTQFAEMGHPLKQHLQELLGREVLFLHGGTSREARDQMVQRFASPQGPPVFLLSLRAGGTGLNLVAANHVVHFDRWWNPAVEDQATDRAFRLGQTRDVQVRKLVCAGTLEERIDAMIEDKRALAGKVVGEGEGWLADLSVGALQELVGLSEDAVAEG